MAALGVQLVDESLRQFRCDATICTPEVLPLHIRVPGASTAMGLGRNGLSAPAGRAGAEFPLHDTGRTTPMPTPVSNGSLRKVRQICFRSSPA